MAKNVAGQLITDGEVFLSHDAPARRSHTEDALVPAPSAVLLTFANAKR